MDIHRPAYHFSPPKGWMNDPNGPVWHAGRYHIFYQHNPEGPWWDNIQWGHISSADLLHWRAEPAALLPATAQGEKHCFSGCVVPFEEGHALFYTSVGPGEADARLKAYQHMAVSRDGLKSFVRCKAPPLPANTHGGQVKEWRDPFVWQEEGMWHMLLGGSMNGYGCVLHYLSPNLLEWEYTGPFYVTKDHPFCECPNLLRFGSRSVLLHSPNSAVRYHVGSITVDWRFAVETEGVLDEGGKEGFYAPNTLLNAPNGQYLTWGWIPESARGALGGSESSGALSLPRVLELDSQNRLCQRPAEEVYALRGAGQTVKGVCLNEEPVRLALKGRTAELLLNIPAGAGEVCLDLLHTPDDAERTTLRYSAAENSVTLEKGASSLLAAPEKNFQRALLPKGMPPQLHVFVDHSIIEVFIGGHQAITGRVYPLRPDACQFSLRGKAEGVEVSFWPLH